MMNSQQTKKSKTRGPFRGLRKMVNRLFTNRIFLRVLSIVLAIVIWCMLVASEAS